MIFLQQLIQKRYQVVMKNKLEDLIQYIKEVLQKIIIVVLKYHFSVLQIIESYNQKGQQRLVVSLKLANANEQSQIKSSEGTKKDKEEKERQLRSFSKSSQIAQNINNSSKVVIQQKGVINIRRNSTDLPILMNKQNGIRKMQLQNTLQKQKVQIYQQQQQKGGDYQLYNQNKEICQLNNSSFSPNVKMIENSSNNQNNCIAKDSFRTLPKIIKNESYISDN